MRNNLTFYRLTKNNTDNDFSYTTSKITSTDFDLEKTSMHNLGFNLHVEIVNYTGEDVILAGSLRTNPTIIAPCAHDAIRLGDFDTNAVVIKLFYCNNGYDVKNKRAMIGGLKTIIRVTSRKLNSGAVFIEEIDSYLSTLAQHPVVSRFIAEDATHNDWEKLDIALDYRAKDPAKIYDGYRELSRACIVRQDMIQVRTGNLKKAATMRISIVDSYFVPAFSNKLVYDPTLDDDEFIVESIKGIKKPIFISTFLELSEHSTLYIDQNEVETISGKFCSMVVFQDIHHLTKYFHKRKSIERFREESIYLAEHSGDIRLKANIEMLENDVICLNNTIEQMESERDSLKKNIKDISAKNKYLESEVEDIKSGWSAKMSSDTVLGNIELDKLKLKNSRLEMELKEKAAHTTFKTTMAKNRTEVIKNIISIISIVFTGITTLTAVFSKLKVLLKLTPLTT